MTLDHDRAAEDLINLLTVLDEELMIRLEYRLIKAGEEKTAELLREVRRGLREIAMGPFQ